MGDASDAVIEYLLKPENLEAAFALQDEISVVVNKLHIKFWSSLKTEIEKMLEKEHVTDWSVQFPSSEPEEAIGNEDFYLELFPVAVGDEPYLSFIVQQKFKPSGKGKHRLAELSYGLSLNADAPPLVSSDVYHKKKLPKEVQSLLPKAPLGVLFDEKQFSSYGNVWYGSLGHAIRAKAEVLALSRVESPEADALQREIGVKLLGLFRESRAAVEAANKALKPMHEA